MCPSGLSSVLVRKGRGREGEEEGGGGGGGSRKTTESPGLELRPQLLCAELCSCVEGAVPGHYDPRSHLGDGVLA